MADVCVGRRAGWHARPGGHTGEQPDPAGGTQLLGVQAAGAGAAARRPPRASTTRSIGSSRRRAATRVSRRRRAPSRLTLLRRAYLDLIGLPPTPAEVAAFLADDSPDAWDGLIDTLLASPHYGERWGRHWLDVARYADSSGFEQDYDRPNAWRYRDYVIRSFNQDKPYNRFLTEQLAGDELDDKTDDTLIATGFLRAGPRVLFREKDNPERRYDYLDDMIGTIGTGVLGLTVNCARCHNHKFDPIPQKDYYALAGVDLRLRRDRRVRWCRTPRPRRTEQKNAEIDARRRAAEGADRADRGAVSRRAARRSASSKFPDNVQRADRQARSASGRRASSCSRTQVLEAVSVAGARDRPES